MARYFTLAEAQRQLPAVERALRDALFQKSEYRKAAQDLEKINERVRLSGGARVNPGEMLSLRARRDESVRLLKGALDTIEELGAMVKDLEIGLIDFLTLYRDREVCLCWKLGEDEIRFWHGMEEGFRGRKPIDREFLEQHRGGAAN